MRNCLRTWSYCVGFAAGSVFLCLDCWGRRCMLHFSLGSVRLGDPTGILPAVLVASWVSLLVESSLSGDPGDPCSWMQYLEKPLPAATWV